MKLSKEDLEKMYPTARETAKQENYWLCCGSLDPSHSSNSCHEAISGHPERCRFGTRDEHSEWQRTD